MVGVVDGGGECPMDLHSGYVMNGGGVALERGRGLEMGCDHVGGVMWLGGVMGVRGSLFWVCNEWRGAA